MPIMTTNLLVQSFEEASTQTRYDYVREAGRFVSNMSRRFNKNCDPVYLAKLLKNYAERQDLSKSTYRHYRNSISYSLKIKFGEGAMYEFKHACLEHVANVKNKPKKYRKTVPDEVLYQISQLAIRRKLKSFFFVARLCHAMHQTGIRPGEWCDTSYDPNTRKISVKNAKYKTTDRSFRANGTHRHINLPATASSAFVSNVEWVIENMKGISWKSRQGHASRTLKKMLAELVREKKISRWWLKLRIYDFRHQFAADMKATFDDAPVNVAAVMGHCSVVTAYQHYGRKAVGKVRRSPVSPDAVSVNHVNPATVARLERRKQFSRNRAPIERQNNWLNPAFEYRSIIQEGLNHFKPNFSPGSGPGSG